MNADELVLDSTQSNNTPCLVDQQGSRFNKLSIFELSLLELIEKNSKNHPDHSMRRFYSALEEYLRNNPNSKFRNELFNSLYLRTDGISMSHAVNLIARAISYIWINHRSIIIKTTNINVDDSIVSINDFSKSDWFELFYSLGEVKSKHPYKEEFYSVLKYKSTQTTRIERYKSILLIRDIFYRPDQQLSLLDVGSSIGAGIVEIQEREKFNWEGVDELGGKYTTVKPFKSKDCVALDLDLPSIEWVISCMHYYSDLVNYHNNRKLLNSIVKRKDELKIESMNKDLFDIHKTSTLKRRFDIVSILTTLYQLSDSDIEHAVDELIYATKPGGLVLVTDFVELSGNKLVSIEDWFGKEYSYNIYVLRKDMSNKLLESHSGGKYWHVGAWDNGRCSKFKKGIDYDYL